MVPIITAYINHYWRGQANAPRYAYYGFMSIIAWCVSLDLILTLKFIIFILGYALMPWQAMFSAINGEPPSRKDHWSIQWMQDLAMNVNTGLKGDYYSFGIIYGIFRASLMLPGIWLLGDWHGVLFLGLGYVYYLCGRWSRYWVKSNVIAVGLAEVVMGYAIGQYLLLMI